MLAEALRVKGMRTHSNAAKPLPPLWVLLRIVKVNDGVAVNG